jgi:hypothetical protein
MGEEITELASREIDPTIVVAGSRRLLIRPASLVERDSQLLTWSVIEQYGTLLNSMTFPSSLPTQHL